MKRTKIGLVIASALAAVGLATAALAVPNQQGGQPPEKVEKGKPFKGKVEAMDTTAKTLTVGGTLIYVTDTTKLTKNDKTIKFTEIKVGDEVHGTTRLTFDGKTEAIRVKVGPKEKEKDQEPKY